MLWFWIGFNAFVLLMLWLDLAVFNRGHRAVQPRTAMKLAAFWVALAFVFALLVWWWHGGSTALEFTTGYLIEESLSVDNLFVFLLIFRYFKVPRENQHTVLFWGILGALIMRGLFIWAGVTLINRFEWVVYVFGAFLVYSGARLLGGAAKEVHPERNPVIRFARRFAPVTPDYDGDRFFVRPQGRLSMTPLFIVLLVVESTDVMFAVDSIPAILAVTRDPFIVYTSNVFAILGLRAIFFALAGLMDMFQYLHYGLAAILIFIGAKMLISDFYHMPIWIALGAVVGILAVSILASLWWPGKKQA